MSATLHIDDTEGVQLTDERIERRSSDRIEFAIAGRVTVTEALLGTFEGATLNPIQVTIAVDDSRTVAIDLTDEASLRLETVDVGIATPDADDLLPDRETISAVADDDAVSNASSPDVLAFTVEGVIRGVSTETVDAVATGDPTLESLTFAVDDVRSDGGSKSDALLELALFGYGIVVRRDGRVAIGSGRRDGGDE